MKVVITTDCFLPRWDGISRFLEMVLPKLAKGADVVVFAPHFGDPPVFENVRVVTFPVTPFQFGDIRFSLPDKARMKAAIRDADVVFNQTIGPIGRLGINFGRKYKKPVVSYVHSVEWELARRAVRFGKALAWHLVRLIARRLYNKCSLLLVPSKQVDDVLAGNKIRTKKELLPLGVQVKQFSPPKRKAAAKKKCKINPKKRVIGFCGRIAREKDLPTLYEAFRRVHQKYRNTVLLIVGEGLEEDIPPSRSVLRVGKQDDVIPFLRAMDIFVMPSLTETSSLATMEAMAVGLPVVATPVGSIPEYIEHRETGLLFAREDVDELAEMLAFLLEHPQERKRLGVAARKVMVKNYSWSKAVERLKRKLGLLG